MKASLTEGECATGRASAPRRIAAIACLLAVALLAYPSLAFADIIWPALVLEIRMWSVWPIAIGLAIEFFFYWKIYEITPGKALIADIVANAISAGLGIVLIPLAGILWEFSVGRIVASAIHWGTFNPVTWVATVLLSATINAAVEGYSLKLIFKYPFNRRIFGWLSVANFFSVAVAFASLWVNPYQP